jgi:heme exporter protein D
MDLGPHAGFIVIAYALTSTIVAILVGWVVLDHRQQARSLADLEARGVTRRSASAKVESGFLSGNATVPPP